MEEHSIELGAFSGNLRIDASYLGLKPGNWPSEMKVNGTAFYLEVVIREKGKLMSVLYRNEHSTLTLKVFNN